ncbi:MAG: hypothetical protein Q4G43_08335 [Mobilicoccus sp.]|nr:hypothetical protein [Mobilicoccus sp.]
MDTSRQVIGGTVLALAVYPEKNAPGRALEEATVHAEGVEGDRRKKRPVHVVGHENNPDVTRANVFLDVADDALQCLVGETVRIGRVELRLTEIPHACPGVYAEVTREGTIQVGDTIR